MVSVLLSVQVCLLLVATATALPVFFTDGKTRVEMEINPRDTVEHTAGLGPHLFDPDSAKLMVGVTGAGKTLSPSVPWGEYNIQPHAVIRVKWVASKERDPYVVGVDTNPKNEAAFLDHLEKDADHGSTEEKRFRILHDKMSEGDPRTLLYNIARGLNEEAAVRVQGMVSEEHFAQLITQRCRVPPHPLSLSLHAAAAAAEEVMQTPLHAAARSTAEFGRDTKLLAMFATAAPAGVNVRNGYGCTPYEVFRMFAGDTSNDFDVRFLRPTAQDHTSECRVLRREQRKH